MAAVGSFSLVRSGPGTAAGAARALLHAGLDRPALARTPGLRAWRLLGTGRGASTARGADLRRWALFAVWDDEAALERFLAHSPLARRWAQAEEAWTVRLAGATGHGSWRGVPVVDELSPARTRVEPPTDGPVAVLTRAWVRPRHWSRFARAGVGVDLALGPAPGLLRVVGVGEAPVGLLGTFSLWRSARDVRAWAAGDAAHQRVVARTRTERWYGEELFARFRPAASTGTWDGSDPLAGHDLSRR